MKINSLQILNPQAFAGAKRIAIVGNAGVNYIEAEQIEQCDHVIRFNNFATRAGIEHMDNKHLCHTLVTHFDLHSIHVSPKNVVIGIPFPFNAERIVRQLDIWYPKSTPYMVNPYMNMQMCEELKINSGGYHHPLPSLGFTTLWHLSKMNINSSFFVAGFNWYYDEDTNQMQGYRLNHQPRPTHFNHDYWIESSWISKHLFGLPKWKFSKRCERILHKVKDSQ